MKIRVDKGQNHWRVLLAQNSGEKMVFATQNRITTAINSILQTGSVIRRSGFTQNTLADKKLFA
jgi:hypothetical protein